MDKCPKCEVKSDVYLIYEDASTGEKTCSKGHVIAKGK